MIPRSSIRVENSLVYHAVLMKAGVSAELPSLCERRKRVRVAAHRIDYHVVAAAGGELARGDRDSCTGTETCSSSVSLPFVVNNDGAC